MVGEGREPERAMKLKEENYIPLLCKGTYFRSTWIVLMMRMKMEMLRVTMQMPRMRHTNRSLRRTTVECGCPLEVWIASLGIAKRFSIRVMRIIKTSNKNWLEICND